MHATFRDSFQLDSQAARRAWWGGGGNAPPSGPLPEEHGSPAGTEQHCNFNPPSLAIAGSQTRLERAGENPKKSPHSSEENR